MATYRPATVDDSAVLARMARDRRRAAEAVARPGKTQVWQTTDKVAGASSAADAAQTKAEAAQSAADSAQAAADAAKAKAEAATFPVGACVLMAAKAAPGLAGTWSLVTGVKLPMTGSDATYYVYERTA